MVGPSTSDGQRQPRRNTVTRSSLGNNNKPLSATILPGTVVFRQPKTNNYRWTVAFGSFQMSIRQMSFWVRCSFCRNFPCFPEVSFDAENSNSRSGFQTLAIKRNFSASVNEAMTLYTVPISNGEQSSFRQGGSRSLESSDAMTRHSQIE